MAQTRAPIRPKTPKPATTLNVISGSYSILLSLCGSQLLAKNERTIFTKAGQHDLELLSMRSVGGQ